MCLFLSHYAANDVCDDVASDVEEVSNDVTIDACFDLCSAFENVTLDEEKLSSTCDDEQPQIQSFQLKQKLQKQTVQTIEFSSDSSDDEKENKPVTYAGMKCPDEASSSKSVLLALDDNDCSFDLFSDSITLFTDASNHANKSILDVQSQKHHSILDVQSQNHHLQPLNTPVKQLVDYGRVEPESPVFMTLMDRIKAKQT